MAVQNSSYDHSSYGPGPDDAMTFDASIEQDTSRVRSLLVMVAVIFVAFAVVVWIAYQQGARSAREPGLVFAQQPLKEAPAIKPAETPAKSNVDALIENGTARGPAAGSPPPSAAAPSSSESVPGLRTYAEDTQAANGASPPAAKGNGAELKAADPKASGAGPLAVESSKLPPAGDTTPSAAADKATGAAIAAAKTPDAVKPSAPQPTAAPPQPAAKETAAAQSPKIEVPTPPAAKPAAPAPAATNPAESARSALDGKFVLQLGAFRDAEQTSQMWTEIEKRHTDLLSSLKPDTEIANIPGKGTYYRLRVGPFASDAEAKSICDQLQKRNQPCILRKL